MVRNEDGYPGTETIENELRDVIDYVPQHIAILGPDGRPLYVNRCALDYVGLTLEEYQAGYSERRVFHPDDTRPSQ